MAKRLSRPMQDNAAVADALEHYAALLDLAGRPLAELPLGAAARNRHDL
jgi:hypothetical protein